MNKSWEEVASNKRDRINESISEWTIHNLPIENCVLDFPAKSEILSTQELDITESSALDLVNWLANGKLKAIDVTLAFCKRTAIAHQLVNCVLEFFPETALAQARELDVYFEKHKKPVGPLHGLPISLKDQLRVKDLETSMGYVSWLGICEKTESVMVTLLREAGAVFYIKTSVPQTLMVGETVNNVIGRTVNPRNKHWSCGGSSGGEGAIIALRGSVIGVGTDIGGSIRIPSAYNFLYGIRPSHGRMPYANMANSMEGQETVHSVVGPIAHSAADLRLFLTSVLQQEPWKYDSKVVPMTWRTAEEDAVKLKIQAGRLNLGFYSSDGVVLPHPPILRGVETVVSALKQKGHTLLPWKPYKHEFSNDLINKVFSADGGADIFKDVNASGEPHIPNIQVFINTEKKIDVNQLWDINLQKWNYQNEYLWRWREFENQQGKELDAIIAPITTTAAIRHDQSRYYGYSSVINLLDFTSVVVPVAFAHKYVDLKIDDYKPLSPIDEAVQAEYDPEAYHGAPIAVQIIGRRLSEEKTLAIAEEVGRLLGNV
ncbi:acetamidase [Penicillium taxi]|uniref:acetamidase n=1 Tax=Penicillium taxi TaxID=168475 RepID=UPI002544EB34|nr:acetamidase [Penicillium taxi]KAJ5888523.1 acetamidase [Penicillium taxi]